MINIEKFKHDISEAVQLTRSVARELIIEIFERIKKWYTVTKKSIKLLLSNLDKKRKKEISKQDLIKVLNKVARPFVLKSSHINAIMEVMGDLKTETIRYESFSTAYFTYANQA
jgi:Ca2+-binding EF-hand superfamily protein